MSKDEETEVLYWVFNHASGERGYFSRTAGEASSYVEELIETGCREEDITVIKGKKQEVKAVEVTIQDYEN